MKKNGFTLVELLSIVVILGIIVVVALPQISGSIGSKKEKQYNKIVKIEHIHIKTIVNTLLFFIIYLLLKKKSI